MTTNIESKLKRLLNMHVADTVLLASYLSECGISRDLQNYYVRNNWLKRIGAGAFVRPGDSLDWQAAVYSLQSQAKFPLYIGATTALAMLGYQHYVRPDSEKVFLFSASKSALPKWVREQDWSQEISFQRTTFIKREDIGKKFVQYKNFQIEISTPERAILETLYLVPNSVDFVEAYQLLESLTTLRPSLLMELLNECGSIKVKRLFLFMAKKIQHAWFKHLDVSSVELGSGVHSFVRGGVFVPEFKIVVPKEIANHE